MRNYSIIKEKDGWWRAEATDRYGNKYQNYFETYERAGKWIFYIWENEDEFVEMTKNKDKLLANAIKACKEIDEKAGRRPIM